MTHPDPAWLDTQYNNRARIPEHAAIFERWGRASLLAREIAACRIDVAYGGGPNETLDVFPGAAANAPVLVFIHGGWWRSLDKRDHSFIAPAFTRAGALVIVPNYALCPTVTIETITLQLVRALAWVRRHAALYGGDARPVATSRRCC
jgi:arylformamidase